MMSHLTRCEDNQVRSMRPYSTIFSMSMQHVVMHAVEHAPLLEGSLEVVMSRIKAIGHQSGQSGLHPQQALTQFLQPGSKFAL